MPGLGAFVPFTAPSLQLPFAAYTSISPGAPTLFTNRVMLAFSTAAEVVPVGKAERSKEMSPSKFPAPPTLMVGEVL
jgi:hypothetical protein